MSGPPTTLRRVSKAGRCPICNRDHYCLVSRDGSEVVCTKIESDLFIKRLNGWKHVIGEPTEIRREISGRWVRPGPNPEMRVLNQKYQAAIDETSADKYAESLGLEAWPLNAIGMGWCKSRSAHTFPMHNDRGEVVGIRLRNQDGEKWSISGSANGLFGHEFNEPDMTVYVAEGPTDTAALIQLGFFAWGRSHCRGETETLATLAGRFVRNWVIVADNETPLEDCRQCGPRRDCSACRPGKFGAYQLADCLVPLARAVTVIFPIVGKDAREWVTKHNGTRKAIEAAVRTTAPIKQRRLA